MNANGREAPSVFGILARAGPVVTAPWLRRLNQATDAHFQESRTPLATLGLFVGRSRSAPAVREATTALCGCGFADVLLRSVLFGGLAIGHPGIDAARLAVLRKKRLPLADCGQTPLAVTIQPRASTQVPAPRGA
jgi:hypothetical protein